MSLGIRRELDSWLILPMLLYISPILYMEGLWAYAIKDNCCTERHAGDVSKIA